MTPAGNALIDELVNEINQGLADDKARLNLLQGVNVMKVLYKSAIWIPAVFLMVFWIALTLALLVIEVEDIAQIRAISDSQIIEFIKFVTYLGVAIGLLGAVIMSARFSRDVKMERVLDDQQRVNQVIDAVRITEEVLLRHNLIKTVGTSHE